MNQHVTARCAEKPGTLCELTPAARDALIVSTVRAGADEHALSRYGDDRWDLSPLIPNANKAASSKHINWTPFPAAFRDSVKAAAFSYGHHRLPGLKRPKALTVISFVAHAGAFCRWLAANGVTRFRDVRPLHYAAYVHHTRRAGLAQHTRMGRFSTVEKLFLLRDHMPDRLTEQPWPDSSAAQEAGLVGRGAPISTTPIIPGEVIQALFGEAVRVLEKAGPLLDARDALERLGAAHEGQPRWVTRYRFNVWLKSQGLPSLNAVNTELRAIRPAAYVVLASTSGCRNHELTSIEAGCFYHSEDTDGERYHWLRGVSLKTGAGATEWLVPEIAGLAVRVLTRWSAPLRQALATRRQRVKGLLERLHGHRYRHAHWQQRLALEHQRCSAEVNRLFLGQCSGHSIATVSASAWSRHELPAFARRCGIQSKLGTHQFRRTYAVFVAHNALGDLRYLRHHFKHWSMDMTLLYAQNAAQDAQLFNEILDTVSEEKVRIVEHWLDDDVLICGGAAETVKAFRRQHTVTTVKDRHALAKEVAETVTIRGTGTAWCLAEGAGCGGQGIYEPTRCAGCGHSMIDDTHLPIYRGLWDQQLELLALDDIGPGGLWRVRRDIVTVKDVLGELGIAVTLPEAIEDHHDKA